MDLGELNAAGKVLCIGLSWPRLSKLSTCNSSGRKGFYYQDNGATRVGIYYLVESRVNEMWCRRVTLGIKKQVIGYSPFLDNVSFVC